MSMAHMTYTISYALVLHALVLLALVLVAPVLTGASCTSATVRVLLAQCVKVT